MSVTELLQSARFVVDADGNKKSVLVDYDIWEELLTILEDWEDAQEIKQLRMLKEEAIPWGRLRKNSRTKASMYNVRVLRAAMKDIEDLPRDYTRLVSQHIDQLGQNPRPAGAKRLSHPGWRLSHSVRY